MNRVWWSILLAFGSTPLYAASGDLDPGFGAGGVARATFAVGTVLAAPALAVQPNGKIVAAGGAQDFVLARFTTDGSLDPDFGAGGTVTTAASSADGVNAIAIDSVGRLIAGGGAYLARYTSDGSLDPGFGTNGLVQVGGAVGYVRALALEPDDDIVTASFIAYGELEDFGVSRFEANGSIDATFGVGGTVRTDFAGEADAALDVAIQGDDKIVTGGYAELDEIYRFALIRYGVDGSYDTGFGTAGTSTVPSPYSEVGQAIALQTDGKIVMVGDYTPGRSPKMLIRRCNADGSLDATFSLQGRAVTRVNRGSGGVAVVIQNDGKIVVAATGGLLRLNADGTSDRSFGRGGRVKLARLLGAGDGVSLWGLALQDDGKILAVGRNQTFSDLVVMRFLP